MGWLWIVQKVFCIDAFLLNCSTGVLSSEATNVMLHALGFRKTDTGEFLIIIKLNYIMGITEYTVCDKLVLLSSTVCTIIRVVCACDLISLKIARLQFTF